VIARATTNNRHQQRTTEEVNMGYSINMLRMDDIHIKADGLARLNAALPPTCRTKWSDGKLFGDTAEEVAEELCELGFIAETAHDGVTIEGWDGQKQPWEWQEILRAIAVAAPESEAVWVVVGEDLDMWAHLFGGGKVNTEDVEISVAGKVLVRP
jgi:hypothetical protein